MCVFVETCRRGTDRVSEPLPFLVSSESGDRFNGHHQSIDQLLIWGIRATPEVVRIFTGNPVTP